MERATCIFQDLGFGAQEHSKGGPTSGQGDVRLAVLLRGEELRDLEG